MFKFKAGDKVHLLKPKPTLSGTEYTVAAVRHGRDTWGQPWECLQLEEPVCKFWYTAKDFKLVTEKRPSLRNTSMSKTKRISRARDKIMSVMKEYAKLAYGWDMNKEDDIDSFEDEVDKCLEELLEKR